MYAYMLGQHLESEAKKGHEIHFENLDSLLAGLGFTLSTSSAIFLRVRTEAMPIVELIAAAREPASRWQWRRRSSGTT